jgi:uncharacterized membrane protein
MQLSPWKGLVEDRDGDKVSVDNHFTRQYNPEDSSEHHTRRRENLKSHILMVFVFSLRYFMRMLW